MAARHLPSPTQRRGGIIVGKGNSLVHCERTDVGRKRSSNQDSLACLPPSSPAQYRQRGWLFLVADGMGAHAAGEQASGIAAERVPIFYTKAAGRSPALALRRSLEIVNEEIHSSGESTPAYHGMGTTCTALAILPRGVIVGHVGDSRAYRIRGTTIEQLTRDHSLVWELESAMPAGQAATGNWPPKNIITRSMGPHAGVAVDLEGPFPVEEDDVYLLASDGLTGQVADEEIGLFAAQLDPREAAEALVGLTLVRGAPDNVTLIVLKAGSQEVSEKHADDEPWPMTEPDAPAGPRSSIPWKPLVAAAVALFAALAAWGQAQPPEWPPKDVVKSAALAATALFFAAFVVSLLWAIFQAMGPTESMPAVLVPGARLGKGPYRSYSCAATVPLIEGIVSSIESAAESLPPRRRGEAAERLAAARRQAAAGEHRDALRSVKRALDLHVEAIRS